MEYRTSSLFSITSLPSFSVRLGFSFVIAVHCAAQLIISQQQDKHKTLFMAIGIQNQDNWDRPGSLCTSPIATLQCNSVQWSGQDVTNPINLEIEIANIPWKENISSVCSCFSWNKCCTLPKIINLVSFEVHHHFSSFQHFHDSQVTFN